MSGLSGQDVRLVDTGNNDVFLSVQDRQNISSLLSGFAWNVAAAAITYSIPTEASVYGTEATYGDPAPFHDFSSLDSAGHSGQLSEVERAFRLIQSYTSLTFDKITETATTHASIRLANSSSPASSYAYNPSTSAVGGDVFYGGTGENPTMGNFDSGQAILHEIGHALGLEHGQLNPGIDPDKFGGMNADRLDIEFSLMNYPNYIGAGTGGQTTFEGPQTYMMYDIAALQFLYGANWSGVGKTRTYSWSSGTSSTPGVESINGVPQGSTPYLGHIFETIWTAGAETTYDLSNFSQDQVDDMNPGRWMLFSTSQLADLDSFTLYGLLFDNPAYDARGNIFNALQYQGDERSLIDNLTTGTGNDTIIGNAVANIINAGDGNDKITGGGGDDTIYGGDGIDTAFFYSPSFMYKVDAYGNKTIVKSIFALSYDGTDTLYDVEKIVFSGNLAGKTNDLSAGTALGSLTSDGSTIPFFGASKGNEESSGGSTPTTGQAIVGSNDAEQLYGTSAGEAISGLGGDDVLTGYGGQDSFDGGQGSDTVDYSYEPTSVDAVINLTSHTATFLGYYTESLVSIENVWSGAGNDTIFGDNGANDLRGGPGNDTLTGGLGNDHIYGDWKYSDQGGVDTAVLSYAFGTGYTVSGSASALHIVGNEGDDWYYHVESFEFAGGVTVSPNALLTINSQVWPQQLSGLDADVSGNNHFATYSNAGGVWLRDLATGTNTHIAVGGDASINEDGSRIAFRTATEVYVQDIATGVAARVNIDENGMDVQGYNPEISADGNHVVFNAFSSSGIQRVLMRDVATNTTRVVSVNSNGVEANADSIGASISFDGRYVSFVSLAGNLEGGGDWHAYERDLLTGTTTSTDGATGKFFIVPANVPPAMSADGRFIAYWTFFGRHINLFDRDTGETATLPVFTSRYGGSGNDQEWNLSISGDGRYIAFSSAALDLVPGGAVGSFDSRSFDVFVYDTIAGTTTLVSKSGSGVQDNSYNLHPVISTDGRFVSWENFSASGGRSLVADLSLNGQPPTAVDDNYVTGEANAVIGNVIDDSAHALDFDPDGDILTVFSVNGLAANVGHLYGLPSGATLTVNPDGRFAYDPNGVFDALGVGQTAIDTFTYAISDGRGHVDTATVTITIEGAEAGVAISGGSGTIIGTPVNDHIAGGDGDEIINGLGGFDWLQGGAGADALDGGVGSDWLDGGIGADTMSGGPDDDVYVVDDNGDVCIEHADEGTDLVQTTSANYALGVNVENLIFTDTGAHTGTGNEMANDIRGNSGNDLIFAGAGHDTLMGGDGDDTLVGNADIFAQESDTIDGGAGNDTIYGEFTDTISGGSGLDVLYAVNAFDFLVDLGVTGIEFMISDFGDDTINGSTQTASVEIYGSGGNDTITGSAQSDMLWAGVGNDIVSGGGGDDMLFGDTGVDSLSAGDGNDRLYVDSDDTLIDGGTGVDVAYITTGPGMTLNMQTSGIEIVVDFAGGNDTLNGAGLTVDMTAFTSGGTDVIIGGSGNDFLWGEAGTDTITGNNGGDVLVGGTGADVMTGGAGVDVIYMNSGGGTDGALDRAVFGAGWGTDFVFDFMHGEDKLDLSSFGIDFLALNITNDPSGSHAYIHIGAGADMIVVANNVASGFSETDFVF